MCKLRAFLLTKKKKKKTNISLWSRNFLSEDWKVKFPCLQNIMWILGIFLSSRLKVFKRAVKREIYNSP